MSMIAPIKCLASIVMVSLLLVACQSQTNNADNKEVELVLVGENSNWSYQIYVNDKCFIQQEYIPAVAGKLPFQSKNDAELVGNLVVDKIKDNKLPTVNLRELRLLGITGAF